jgi:hypothetical protein
MNCSTGAGSFAAYSDISVITEISDKRDAESRLPRGY